MNPIIIFSVIVDFWWNFNISWAYFTNRSIKIYIFYGLRQYKYYMYGYAINNPLKINGSPDSSTSTFILPFPWHPPDSEYSFIFAYLLLNIIIILESVSSTHLVLHKYFSWAAPSTKNSHYITTPPRNKDWLLSYASSGIDIWVCVTFLS